MTTVAPRPGDYPVALFGAIHMDTIAHANVTILRETSTPARFETRPGGVAANVARALARLGSTPALVGAVGRDSNGEALLMRLAAEGVSIAAVIRSPLPTGRYIALHDPDGGLAAAAVDAAITDRLEADAFLPLHPATRNASCWFIEANLPPPLLESLLDTAGSRRVIADAVSRAKAERLKPFLRRIGLLFCNRAEASVLTGLNEASPVAELGEGLLGLGVGACCVMDGAEPIAYGDRSGIRLYRPLAANLVDVTGAGDALIAAFIAASLQGKSADACLRSGLAAAAITLESPGSVPDSLSAAAITARLARSEEPSVSA
ncbi:kinase [Stappia sp. F7233]|uniref:Kinase n=1 Tax=Stappia albiluteola TaxID=2758565 RepID=A0A839AGN8_9HYPH|nr:PfkB family carbohydrate kinase [Stappia albiluteola]MBA5777709.1 kinase [Stappia albiluteola]